MSAKLRPLELKDVIELLRSEVERAGGQSAFAKKAGVDRARVNRVLRGRLAPTQKIIEALNLRIVYLPK
jgi:DNA-binding phage protein